MNERAARLIGLALCGGLALSPVGGQTAHAETLGALLQALDKVTARVSELEAPLDQPVRFGTLTITAHACHKTPPEEPPESAAFLEIEERREGEPSTPLFTGWMFASSPGLSALEHPVYDIWVLDCITESEEPAQDDG